MSLDLSLKAVDYAKNDYASNVNFSNSNFKTDLYPQSNVLDIGDIAEFEHTDNFEKTDESQNLGDSIKGFVKNLLAGFSK